MSGGGKELQLFYNVIFICLTTLCVQKVRRTNVVALRTAMPAQ